MAWRKRQRLELLSKPRDLFEVRQGDRRDAVAAIVLELDEPVGDQPGQRLAQRAEADRETFPRPLEVDLAAGLELAGHDGFAQAIDELARNGVLAVVDQSGS